MSYNYHLVHEELNMKVLRTLNVCLMAYVFPLWIQLFYMGEAGVESGLLPEIPDVTFGAITLNGYVPALLTGNLVMIVFAFLHEVIQDKVQNFYLYLMLHLVLLAGIAFPMSMNRNAQITDPGSGTMVIPRLCIAIVIIMIEIGSRIKEIHNGYPSFGWLFVGIGMCLFSAIAGFHDMAVCGYVTEMFSAVLAAMYYNALSLQHALGQTGLTKALPIGRVKQLNLYLMLFWILVGAVLIAVFTLTGVVEFLLGGVGSAISYLFQRLVAFIMWLLAKLPRGAAYSQTVQAYENLQQEELTPISALLMLIVTAIWETMVQIMKIGGSILLVWFLISEIRVMIRSFQQARLEEKEVRGLLVPEEARTLVRVKREKRLSFWNRTPAASIRRQYIALVRNSEAFKSAYRTSLTPLEIEEKVLLTEMVNSSQPQGVEGDLKLIRNLYEKARYVPETCSIQDAQQMRKLVRQLRDVDS